MRGQKPGRGTKDEMKNATDYLKQCSVPTVADKLSPTYLARDNKKQREKRTAWGNNDFKSLIRENMKGFEDEENKSDSKET